MTTDKKRALGRGLDALLPTVTSPPRTASGATYGDRSVFLCPIEALHPQQGQPRQRLDPDRLEELAASIREHGLLEPLVVRRIGNDNHFEIVAGERRWRAAQRAGLKELMVVVKDVSTNAAFELALIENIQREDLDAIELAEALERLIQEHNYTHETLAQRLHKDRTTITNSLRLLKLPPSVRSMVMQGQLTEGHARALLGAPDNATLEQLADKAVRGRLSVRKVEALVRRARTEVPTPDGPQTDPSPAPPRKSPNIRDVEKRIGDRVGLRAEVRDHGGKGELVVYYSSLDDFDRIMAALGLQ